MPPLSLSRAATLGFARIGGARHGWTDASAAARVRSQAGAELSLVGTLRPLLTTPTDP